MGPEGNSGANEWRLADGVNEEPMMTAVRKHFVAPPSSLPCKSCHTTGENILGLIFECRLGKEPKSCVTA